LELESKNLFFVKLLLGEKGGGVAVRKKKLERGERVKIGKSRISKRALTNILSSLKKSRPRGEQGDCEMKKAIKNFFSIKRKNPKNLSIRERMVPLKT